jgi:hypothetical protein
MVVVIPIFRSGGCMFLRMTVMDAFASVHFRGSLVSLLVQYSEYVLMYFHWFYIQILVVLISFDARAKLLFTVFA